jgi:hypothetical protein
MSEKQINTLTEEQIDALRRMTYRAQWVLDGILLYSKDYRNWNLQQCQEQLDSIRDSTQTVLDYINSQTVHYFQSPEGE